MDERRSTEPNTGGTPAEPAHLGEVSPLPRAVEVFVPQGTYGMGPHVPTTPYIPPLPPALREAEENPKLRVVGEDPLEFLAKQAEQHRREALPTPAPPVPSHRFRTSEASDEPTPPPPRDPSMGSVPPPTPARG